MSFTKVPYIIQSIEKYNGQCDHYPVKYIQYISYIQCEHPDRFLRA